MSRKARILVVEDEESMLAGLEYALISEGYEVSTATDGEQGLAAIRGQELDLVLLDVMMPKLNGFEVLERTREEGRQLPVILLTAKGQELDKVRGLDLGADDYVVKPFALSELLARIRARLRRSEGRDRVLESLELGPCCVDFKALEVRWRGAREDEKLSVRELEMLRLLARERGQVVSRNRFLDEVWGHDHFPTTRTVDQHVAKLRKKIELDPADPKFLLTVFGRGYRLEI